MNSATRELLFACQQALYALDQHPGLEWLSKMKRTPYSQRPFLICGGNMSGDGYNRDGTKCLHLPQVSYSFPPIHIREGHIHQDKIRLVELRLTQRGSSIFGE